LPDERLAESLARSGARRSSEATAALHVQNLGGRQVFVGAARGDSGERRSGRQQPEQRLVAVEGDVGGSCSDRRDGAGGGGTGGGDAGDAALEGNAVRVG
jgi:hypothetical protein